MQIVPFVRGAERQKESGSVEGWAEWHSDAVRGFFLGGGGVPRSPDPMGGPGAPGGEGAALCITILPELEARHLGCAFYNSLWLLLLLCAPLTGGGQQSRFCPPHTHTLPNLTFLPPLFAFCFLGLVPLGAGEPR